MGTSCCEGKSSELEKIVKSQRQVLVLAFLLNVIMFFVEFASGIAANSISLMGDSLDMLGDAIAYAASLYALSLSIVIKARVAMLKGWIIVASAIFVLIAAVYRTFFQQVPTFEVMGVVGGLALGANVFCLWLLSRHRTADVNMESVWLCSRNDVISNLSVLAAAGLVKATGSSWPDLAVGIFLALLFTKSALKIFSNSRFELAKAERA